jgi:WD40 repeat protein
VAFSPDGEWLASGSTDRTIRLWALSDGTSRVLGEHPGRVYWLAFHPDGRRLGAGSSDGTARIWTIRTGEFITLRGHHNEVNSVRFSASGDLAFTASDDGTVRTWHSDTGRPYWHAPAMLTVPPSLYSHRGWRHLEASLDSPGGGGQQAPPVTAWRQAIEDRAQWAFSESAKAGEPAEVWCLHTVEGQLEMWNRRLDEAIGSARPVAGLSQVLAIPGGCVTRGQEGVTLHRAGHEPQRLAVPGLSHGASYSDGQILVVTDREVRAFTPAGEALSDYRVGIGARVVALAPVRDLSTARWLVVGYRDGNIDLVPTNDRLTKPSYSFEQVPASPPMAILVGPMHTLIVGYANGLLGMWSQLDGTRLAHARLHGPVSHLRIVGDKLYAATALGRSLVWDLSLFYAERCALLREVWQDVPVIWQRGQPLVAPPPPGHRCITGALAPPARRGPVQE